jgi:hypothetical protein
MIVLNKDGSVDLMKKHGFCFVLVVFGLIEVDN